MLRQFEILFGNPTLRMVVWASLLFGGVVAPINAYQSLIAIQELGIADGTYAIVLFVALLVSTGGSVWVGIVTDQKPIRRLIALGSAVAMTLGIAGMAIAPAGGVFIIAHALLLPLSGSLFGQFFAIARLASGSLSKAERDGVASSVRATFAVPFIVVLPFWGWVFATGVPLTSIYLVNLSMCLLILYLFWRSWPHDEGSDWGVQQSGLGIWASLAEVMAPAVLLRVGLIGAVHVGASASAVILGLIFAGARTDGAEMVGIFFGSFVAIEFIVMLLIGGVLRWFRRLHLIAVGAVLYAVYLISFPSLAGSPWVWILIIPAGAGGAMIYALAIPYLQDLLGNRVGAGSALIAVQRAFAEGMGAVIFALGTWLYGYALVAYLAAAITLVAMAAILWLDGGRKS